MVPASPEVEDPGNEDDVAALPLPAPWLPSLELVGPVAAAELEAPPPPESVAVSAQYSGLAMRHPHENANAAHGTKRIINLDRGAVEADRQLCGPIRTGQMISK